MTVSLLAVSCSVNDMDSKNENRESFYATIEQPSDKDTKVYVNQNLRVLWNEGEHISIFNKKDSNDEYYFTGQTGDAGGSFELVKDFSEEGVAIDKVYAVYPYSRATSIDIKGTLSVEFPSEQHYRENSFGPGDNLMVSVSKDKDLQFKNVGGYLRISLYGEGASVTSITLKGNNGEKLAGKAAITMPLDGIPSMELADDATDVITLTCDSPVELASSAEESSCFWFVVPPVSFDQGFTISVKDGSGKYFEKKTTKPISIERNRLSKMSPLSFDELEPKEVKVAYNLIITGPGVVDEYLSEDGTKAILKAIPSDGAPFKGWSGSVSSMDSEIIIDISEKAVIVASFGNRIHEYPLPDLNQPSVSLKRFYPEFFTSRVCTYAGNMLTCDYNRDGYPDLITSFTGDQQKAPIRFYLGGKNGGLTPDPINDSHIMGLDECRKIIYGEYNGDDIVDICIISHGYDADPFPGDYPLILLSNPDGSYRDIRFPSYVGFYHGGTAGDFDNDGDTDIFFCDSQNEDSVFLINDGNGVFTPNQTIVPNTGGKYTAELIDLDKDGFLDLFLSWPGQVIWGNGRTYADNDVSQLPIPSHGSEGYLDFAFYDLDNDGVDEILTCATHDYTAWEIQVIDYIDGKFKDVTRQYFLDDEYYKSNDGIIIWLNLECIDDRIYLVGRMDGHKDQTRLLFEFKEGRFSSINSDNDELHEYNNGFCLYSDGFAFFSPFVDLGYQEDKYGGYSCMRFSDWATWNGWSLSYSDWVDFSGLEKNEYYLEFAIKNEDPDLDVGFSFETVLQTDPWYFPSYGYTYRGNEHRCDGTWELVQVPLSSMICDPEWTGYYWNTIKTINIAPGDCHGQDFFLDEIRIRRIIDTQ